VRGGGVWLCVFFLPPGPAGGPGKRRDKGGGGGGGGGGVKICVGPSNRAFGGGQILPCRNGHFVETCADGLHIETYTEIHGRSLVFRFGV